MKFPTLNSGAVSQYPATKVARFRSHRIRFVDGREQRFRNGKRMTRSWMIRLADLAGDEMARVEAFSKEQAGIYATFEFTDPFDGVTYAECYFGSDESTLEWVEHGRGKTVLWIHETGG